MPDQRGEGKNRFHSRKDTVEAFAAKAIFLSGGKAGKQRPLPIFLYRFKSGAETIFAPRPNAKPRLGQRNKTIFCLMY